MAKSTSKNGHAKPKAEESLTAYFLSLEVENVRCFGEKQKLDLSDGNGKPAPWTIILGVNGTGKTTLLQCLVGFTSNNDNGFDQSAENYSKVLFSLIDIVGIFRSGATKFAITLTASFSKQLHGENTNISKLDCQFKKTTTGCDGTIDTLAHSATKVKAHQPIILAYGAGRRIGEISFLEESVDDDPTGTLFSDKAKLRNPEEWLIYLDYTSSTKHMVPRDRVLQRKRREIAIHLLKEVLWEIDGIRFIPGEGMRPKPRVEFLTKFGWVPFRQLGYGYQSLATWVADFASRMVERYPYSENPLAEPAVVLVDEIDLHLHPKWQRELMGRLTKLFPNTQFIATAHSPLIAQAAADANLAVLRRDGDQVLIDNDVDYIRNWRVDQILTSDLFGLDSARPPHIAKQIAERDKILGKAKLTKADEKKLEELEAEIGELPFGESKQQNQMMKDIQESLELLKKEAALKK